MDELDRAALSVAARALEQERRRVQRQGERFRLLLVGHGRLDDLPPGDDLDPVALAQKLIERAVELETSPKRLESKIKECWELADCLAATECKYDLTTEILDSLVEKIFVFHDKSFEIVWRFADEFAERSAVS